MEKGRDRVGSVGGEGRTRGWGPGGRAVPDGESLLPVYHVSLFFNGLISLLFSNIISWSLKSHSNASFNVDVVGTGGCPLEWCAERPKLYVLLLVSKSSACSLFSSRNLTELLNDSAGCAGGAFK